MNNFEENAIKIANYLEDKMSPAEEEAFMQELGADEELRQQYEEELLVSSLLQNKEEAAVGSTDLLLQSADEHINMIEKVLERKAIHKNEAPVIPMFSFYKKIAAAAVVVIIAGSVFFILQKKKNNQPVTTAKTFIVKDSGTKSDSIIKFIQPRAEEITKARSSGDSNTKINSTVKIQSQKPAQAIEKNTPNDNSKADSITARQSRYEQIAKAQMLEDKLNHQNLAEKTKVEQVKKICEGLALADKPIVAVMPFKIAIREAPSQVSHGLPDMLDNALVNTGCFRIVDRAKLDDIMKEQGTGLFAAQDENAFVKVGKMAGAQVLIFGTITEFKEIKSGDKGRRDFAFKVGPKTANIRYTLEFIDATTGKLLDSKSFNNQKTAVGLADGSLFTGETAGELFYKNKSMQDAIEESVIEAVVYMSQNKNAYVGLMQESKALAKDNTKTDSTGKVQPLLPADNAIAESAFKNFYTRYSNGENDPVEISDYYKSYTEGDYTKVLSATDADYQLMGTGERSNLLKQYMQLYKGLAYLAEDKPADAIQKFDLVLQSSLKTAPQYYEAQWYSALAWLKINDANKAAAIAKDIIQTASVHSKLPGALIENRHAFAFMGRARQFEMHPTASTYRLKAIQLLNALHVK